MSRAKWKGPWFFKNKRTIHQIHRNSEILPTFLGLTFSIYNGKELIELKVSDEMIGHKFGEFIFTRAKFSFKKQKTKKSSGTKSKS